MTASTTGAQAARTNAGHAATQSWVALLDPRRSHLPRHYLEMVIAMFVGMMVLAPVTDGVLGLAGIDTGVEAQPELASLAMAWNMSVGMVAWMRYRGHRWGVSLEMAGAMFAAAVVFFPLLWLGLISGTTLFVLMHVAMFPLMLAVMLLRPAEYAHGHHATQRSDPA